MVSFHLLAVMIALGEAVDSSFGGFNSWTQSSVDQRRPRSPNSFTNPQKSRSTRDFFQAQYPQMRQPPQKSKSLPVDIFASTRYNPRKPKDLKSSKSTKNYATYNFYGTQSDFDRKTIFESKNEGMISTKAKGIIFSKGTEVIYKKRIVVKPTFSPSQQFSPTMTPSNRPSAPEPTDPPMTASPTTVSPSDVPTPSPTLTQITLSPTLFPTTIAPTTIPPTLIPTTVPPTTLSPTVTTDSPTATPTMNIPTATPTTPTTNVPTPSVPPPTTLPTSSIPTNEQPTISPSILVTTTIPTSLPTLLPLTPAPSTLTTTPTSVPSVLISVSSQPSLPQRPSDAPNLQSTPTNQPTTSTMLPTFRPSQSQAPTGPPTSNSPTPLSRTVTVTPFFVTYLPVSSATDQEFELAADITLRFLDQFLEEFYAQDPDTTYTGSTSFLISESSNPAAIEYDFTALFGPDSTRIPSATELDLAIQTALTEPSSNELIAQLNLLPTSNPFSATIALEYAEQTFFLPTVAPALTRRPTNPGAFTQLKYLPTYSPFRSSALGAKETTSTITNEPESETSEGSGKSAKSYGLIIVAVTGIFLGSIGLAILESRRLRSSRNLALRNHSSMEGDESSSLMSFQEDSMGSAGWSFVPTWSFSDFGFTSRGVVSSRISQTQEHSYWSMEQRSSTESSSSGFPSSHSEKR